MLGRENNAGNFYEPIDSDFKLSYNLPMQVNWTAGERLKMERQTRFASIETAAAKCGVSVSTVRRWEANIMPKREDAVKALRRYIEKTLRGDAAVLCPDVFGQEETK